jgi:integrase/recombinase XerD
VNPSDDNGYLNSQLSLIKNKLNQAFLLLQYQRNKFNVNDIYNQFLGKRTTTEKTLIDAFNYHYKRMGKLVGIEITPTSVKKPTILL